MYKFWRAADSLNLRINRHLDQIIQSELGITLTGHYTYKKPCAPGTLVPRIKVSYISDAPLRNRHLRASFVNSDCGFGVKGLTFCQNLAAASLGLTYLNCNDTIGVTLRYDGQCGRDYYNQAANIAIEIAF